MRFRSFHFMLKFHASDAAPAAGAEQASRSPPGLPNLQHFFLLVLPGSRRATPSPSLFHSPADAVSSPPIP
eukprot:762146-Hanusia_phi.AAC.1